MQKQSKKTSTAKSSVAPLRAIFASLTPLTEAPKSSAQVMRGYSCGDCTATFAFNRITAGEGEFIEPICPDCGSENTAELEGDQSIETLTEANAVNLTCHACNTQHIFSSETQAGLNNSINCTVCGTTISYFDDDEESQSEDDQEMGEDDDIDVGDGAFPGLDDDDDAFADTQENFQGDDLPGAPDDTIQAGDEEGDEEDEEDEEAGADGCSDDHNQPAPATASEDLEDLDLVDALEDDPEEEDTMQASFVRTNDRVIAFLNDVSVGVLHRKDVLASRQEAFDSPAYLQALTNSYTTAGMSSTLDDFGFQRTKIKVSAKHAENLSRRRVEAAAQAQVNALDERIRKDTTAAMSIAAVGINKGFWSEEAANNPLKNELLRAFTQAGFRGAEKIIDSAFAAASDPYFKLVASKAEEIMSMEPAIANGLSKAIASMRYSSGFAGASTYGEEDGEDDAEVVSTSVVAAARNGIRPAQSIEAMAAFGPAPSTTGGQKGIHQTITEASKRLGDRLF